MRLLTTSWQPRRRNPRARAASSCTRATKLGIFGGGGGGGVEDGPSWGAASACSRVAAHGHTRGSRGHKVRPPFSGIVRRRAASLLRATLRSIWRRDGRPSRHAPESVDVHPRDRRVVCREHHDLRRDVVVRHDRCGLRLSPVVSRARAAWQLPVRGRSTARLPSAPGPFACRGACASSFPCPPPSSAGSGDGRQARGVVPRRPSAAGAQGSWVRTRPEGLHVTQPEDARADGAGRPRARGAFARDAWRAVQP